MGKAQRRKGADGEREVCAILRDSLGIDAKRNLTQTREGGCDIVCGPFNLEIKRRARIGQIYDWMEQAAASCESSPQTPTVVCRGDGKKWLVVMTLQDWMKLAGNEL